MSVTPGFIATMAIGMVASTAATLVARGADVPLWGVVAISLGTSAAIGFAGGRLSRRQVRIRVAGD